MPHVFKIVQKKFQISTDGSSDALINNLEFISQPYATTQERNTAAILKNNEIVVLNPENVCEVRIRYNGFVANGNYTFQNNFVMFGCGVHGHVSNPFWAQVKSRSKSILQRERPSGV